MAFNPFTSFRKYQKFWMATILLLSMVTFVLCTGVGGDLSDRLVNMFGNRRGPSVAKVNGYNVYRMDLEKLRRDRNIADLFMRNASRFAMNQIDERMKNSDKIPEAQRREAILTWQSMKEDLFKRLAQPRYFSGGVKYDELLNFMLWQQQADRLGINLEREALTALIFRAVYGSVSHFDSYASLHIQAEVRASNYQATDDVIYSALRDEFRVQIAQLALMESRPDLLLSPANPADPFQRHILEFGGPILYVSHLPEIRRPLPPEQLWEYFKKERSEFDVALVPVPVDDFLTDVPPPTEAQLQDLYEHNRDNDFNPTIDRPSFKFPPRMKVQWVSADPESPYYRKLSRAATTLESTPAIAWTPMLPAPLAAARYAAQSAAWDASLLHNYESFKRVNPERYEAPFLTAENFLLELANLRDKSSPATAVALVGSVARPGLALAAPWAYEADIYFRHQKELASVLPALVKPRVPLAASMWLGGAASPTLPIGIWLAADARHEFLPLGLVRDELRDKLELKMAQEWAVHSMLDVKDKLNLPGTPGKKKAMERRVADLQKRYGLEVKETEHFHNRYDIAKAPALQPLLKSFEKYRVEINIQEGRSGKSEMLKEDDFWRLFFDSSIGYSVENAGLYVARPWPPDVKAKRTDFGPVSATVGEEQTIPLFKMSGHPFLFWQTEFEPARLPKSLDEVRDKVVYAWKHLEARDKWALPRAKAIAQALQRAGKDLRPFLTEEAAKLGHEVIMLRGVAPLVALPRAETQTYGPYELPKDVFVYPREDMVKELLRLNELSAESKEAIKADNLDLDRLNEELLKNKLAGKQVQVLTNKPRSYYYVAVVLNAPEASRGQFVTFVYAGAGQNLMRVPRDSFVDYTQAEAGKAYQKALLGQLREAYLEPDKDARASFDRDGGG